MARISVQQRTLRRAGELVGGVAAAGARTLMTALASLTRWLDGEETMPSWVFLRAVDIVNAEEDLIYAEMRCDQAASNDPAQPVPFSRRQS
jgi:hypothetical protein